MSGFVAIDLSRLPAPAVVEPLDYETILAAMKAAFIAHYPDYSVADLESDMAVKVLEVAAYRELLLRSRVNDASRAIMLSQALGTDLDQLAALFGVSRALPEADPAFRARIALAPEAFATTGARGAYIFHALSLQPGILAWAFSPADGRVTVVLAMPDGAPVPDALLDAARDLYAREDVVPLTDVVTVRAAERVDYAVQIELLIRRGPDPAAVAAEAEARIRAYAAERHRIAEEVYLTGLVAAATVGGVEDVTVLAPASDIICSDVQIPHMTNVTVTASAGAP